MPETIPCGRCIGCRLSLSQQWGIRSIHETQYWQENAYITLTYAPEFLPPGATLLKSDFQGFMKKVRKKYTGKTIRYYHSGEYGEATEKNNYMARPHYHALLFNLEFHDLKLLKTQNGIPLYTSKTLTDLWGKGHASVGNITINSAAYVSRYIMKKQTSANQSDEDVKLHYEYVDRETGECHDRLPEYSTMSRNIGQKWFNEFYPEIYRNGFVVHKGQKLAIPKYYDRLYERINPKHLVEIKRNRLKELRKYLPEMTLDRLRTREKCKILQTNRLIRPLGQQI